jgi:hypothetical protein
LSIYQDSAVSENGGSSSAAAAAVADAAAVRLDYIQQEKTMLLIIETEKILYIDFFLYE